MPYVLRVRGAGPGALGRESGRVRPADGIRLWERSRGQRGGASQVGCDGCEMRGGATRSNVLERARRDEKDSGREGIPGDPGRRGGGACFRHRYWKGRGAKESTIGPTCVCVRASPWRRRGRGPEQHSTAVAAALQYCSAMHCRALPCSAAAWLQPARGRVRPAGFPDAFLENTR